MLGCMPFGVKSEPCGRQPSPDGPCAGNSTGRGARLLIRQGQPTFFPSSEADSLGFEFLKRRASSARNIDAGVQKQQLQIL
mmetsp:Transcript_51319/g.142053  ORF Transcript_51319/g.142053 Transcript_51319/m.142053 type:complete len:81 (+) Transcript_51319:2459-2701(+)